MEAFVKKYQRKFIEVNFKLGHWNDHHSQLLDQFQEASAIIRRLPMIQDKKKYGALQCVDGIEKAVLQKQMESLGAILLSMKETMEKLRGIICFLEKMKRDGEQLTKGGSNQPSVKQLKQRIGVRPSLMDCLEGFTLLHDMYHAEYLLKSSIVSSVSQLALKLSSSDLAILQRLLVDQPNIQEGEAQFIFDVILAEEAS